MCPPTISSKISSALGRFITPIKSATPTRSEIKEKKKRDENPSKNPSPFERFGKKDKESQQNPDHSIEKSHSNTDTQELHEARNPKIIEGENIYVEIMDHLQENSSKMKGLLGSSAYQTATKKQKKPGSFRKGTVVDKKAG